VKPIAISIGCPCGIGPEVSVLVAAEAKFEVVLVGDEAVLKRAAETRNVPLRATIVQPTKALRGAVPGKPNREAGAAQLAWIDAACDMVSRGEAGALVTGPVSKEWIARAGSKSFRGHTEHLQKRLGAKEVVMGFYSDDFSTALVTTHIPLRDVPRAVTPEAVARATYWLGWLLDRTGSFQPRIAVCGLNPHAGEDGLLGVEDSKRILPGIRKARTRLRRLGARVEGPVGAETAFRRAKAETYQGVVAMYHDQATIPMKLLAFGDAVNVSLGLPIVRTSVDHGTAYDIAPNFAADPSGMRAALDLAYVLADSS
jgi:4-hydroxythreonine-4-phosphate dehydrogenase